MQYDRQTGNTNNEKTHKKNRIGTVSKNTGGIKYVKAGHHRPASERPFEWHFIGWPTVAQDHADWGMASQPACNLGPLSAHQ